MKYLAVFLLWNILLLSSISGMANTHHKTAACCTESTHKDCRKQPKHTSDNDCQKGTCNATLCCSACGFLISQPISLSPAIIDLNNQMAHRFRVGGLSDYHDNDWNPPKA